MIQDKTIGVIGRGFVGTAVSRGFMNFVKSVYIYDVDPRKSTHSFEETVNADFVFICLPTPMISIEGGRADLSIVEDCIAKISPYAAKNETCYLIKSTVPVGTTKRLANEHNMTRLFHCPEFLTARSANTDFICPARNIVGYVKDNKEWYIKPDRYLSCIAQLFDERFPGVPYMEMTSDESEMVKYMANCFFATKVMFFNEMRLLSDKCSNSMRWDTLIEGVLSDGRIAKSHYQVPGPDLDFGFGGLCFSKDLNALIATMEDYNIDPKVLKAVWKQNLSVRSNWDWINTNKILKKVNLSSLELSQWLRNQPKTVWNVDGDNYMPWSLCSKLNFPCSVDILANKIEKSDKELVLNIPDNIKITQNNGVIKILNDIFRLSKNETNIPVLTFNWVGDDHLWLLIKEIGSE